MSSSPSHDLPAGRDLRLRVFVVERFAVFARDEGGRSKLKELPLAERSVRDI